jgi:hypothetical protein
MSSWRRKAIALFPELTSDLNAVGMKPFDFFMELEEMAISAHASGDVATLRRVHGFAEWCLHHPGELWDRAGISFYENLFDAVTWEKIVPWLSPFVVGEIKKTWALGVNGEKIGEFDRMVEMRREFYYREHVFSTGEIDAL